MINAGMFSSESDRWDTPPDLVADLATVFDWDVDVCANRPNVCATYYDEAQNGLKQMWSGLCWMNPPYGREIGVWMEKAMVSKMATTVCLVPARTDTRTWWHRYVPFANLVVFIEGRLSFGADSVWVDLWLKRWQEGKLSAKDFTRKVGGGWMRPILDTADYLPLLNVAPADWPDSLAVKKESAPFPSAFVVFGELTAVQEKKLASYGMGWHVAKRLEPLW